MKNIEETIAKYLLQSKAIKLEPTTPFIWASGWHSPIYCDNRKTLSFPAIRTEIKHAFVELIKTQFPEAETIAGVATGAIAQGALVADALGLPFIYVRSKPKGHGLENMIEGAYKPGQKTVVIEDLVSTGGSSLKAVEALRASKLEVLGMAAIFTYGFPIAQKNFADKNCQLYTLSNYTALIKLACDTGYVKPDDLNILQSWRENPEKWTGNTPS